MGSVKVLLGVAVLRMRVVVMVMYSSLMGQDPAQMLLMAM
jgi:hypothetical protein